MTDHSEQERTYLRSAYARAWLRHGGRAIAQLGWAMILVGAVLAALAEKGDTPLYLAPAVFGLLLLPVGIFLEAEAER